MLNAALYVHPTKCELRCARPAGGQTPDSLRTKNDTIASRLGTDVVQLLDFAFEGDGVLDRALEVRAICV